MMIRDVAITDAERIREIYNKYIVETPVTFTEEPFSLEEIESLIQRVVKNFPWIVYEEDELLIGFTFADKWKERSAYRNTVESSIYLDSNYTGKGIGSKLKKAMIEELRKRGFHSVISGISLPNPASIAMCEKFGFQKIGHFKEVGYKLGKWVDVGYWQLLL